MTNLKFRQPHRKEAGYVQATSNTLRSTTTGRNYTFTRESKRDVIDQLRSNDTLLIQEMEAKLQPILGRKPTYAEIQQAVQYGLQPKDERSTLQRIADDATTRTNARDDDDRGGNPIRRAMESLNSRTMTPAVRDAMKRSLAQAEQKDAALQAEREAEAKRQELETSDWREAMTYAQGKVHARRLNLADAEEVQFYADALGKLESHEFGAEQYYDYIDQKGEQE